MRDKLVQQYTEKLGVPPCNDRDQAILDLQMFGVASPSFGAAHTLNLLIHGADKYTGTEQTVQIQEAIESQTQALLSVNRSTAARIAAAKSGCSAGKKHQGLRVHRRSK